MTTETRGLVRIEPAAKRVRAFLGDTAVFDTRRPTLVWEGPHFPVYYIPAEDVAADVLVPSDHSERSPSRGESRFWSVRVGDRLAENAARQYPDSKIEELHGLIRFEWGAMDAWFEEDEEVFTHARDPHHRVDILRSSRHVEVILNGVTIADSHRPTLLFETGLPTRYYMPKQDARMDLLERTDTVTRCPYKGEAHLYTVKVGNTRHEGLAWIYRYPTVECAKIQGLVGFLNERVDMYEDGTLLPRPKTIWS